MSIFRRAKEGYSELWKAIIRPPRDQYEVSDLGPPLFQIGHMQIKRTDFQLINNRNLTLQVSHFEPTDEDRVAQQLPCVIYLHGNSSSRIEALPIVQYLLPMNITVLCLDLSGSGMSEGEYISLGVYERDDVALVIEHLRQSGRVTCIGLWGRSMGACTALLHGDRDPSIAGMVLDSPFATLKQLANELAIQHAGKVPKFVLSGILSFVKKTIKKKADFSIYDLAPINHVGQCFIPAMFVAANDDDFIKPHHAQQLYDQYAGDKTIQFFDGDHNSQRPKQFMDAAAIFFYNTLYCENIVEEKPQTSSYEKYVLVENDQFDDYDEDEELRRAIEESLKMSS